MPIKHAAFKHLRQTKKRTTQNKKAKDSLKSLVKAVRKAIVQKDTAKAAEALKKAVRALDKAAQKHVIKKNRASRLKSRLSRQVSSLK